MPKPTSKTVLFPASRRIDWRRSNPCGLAGRVIPGFLRATLRRAGDPQGCTAAGPSGGRTTIRRASLHRVGLPAVAGNCASIPVEAGTFSLTDASGPALILATAPYDFSCLPNANIHIAATVQSKRDVTGGNLFPDYGIFIVTVVPPAADLWVVEFPDVQMTTMLQLDSLFHTYTASATVANPGAGKTIVFAALPDSTGTTALTNTNYTYQNFTFVLTGV